MPSGFSWQSQGTQTWEAAPAPRLWLHETNSKQYQNFSLCWLFPLLVQTYIDLWVFMFLCLILTCIIYSWSYRTGVMSTQCICVCVCVYNSERPLKVIVTQLRLTLCSPMDRSSLVSSIHGILQARILEWVAIPSSRGSPRLRNWSWASWIAGRSFTDWATREERP